MYCITTVELTTGSIRSSICVLPDAGTWYLVVCKNQKSALSNKNSSCFVACISKNAIFQHASKRLRQNPVQLLLTSREQLECIACDLHCTP